MIDLDITDKEHYILVKRCVDWLRSNRDWMLWTNSSGMMKTIIGSYVRVGVNRATDIIGITEKGQFVAIEVKSGKRKQSRQQKSFGRTILNKGGLHFIVRPGSSFEEAFK